MSAALVEHAGPWTVAAVEALPDTGHRYEILSSGVLTVSPAPATRHQRASRRLANLLEEAAESAGADVEILQDVNLVLPGDRLTRPDVVVADGAYAATDPVRFRPENVVAVIEIVSPGSEAQDRLLKPQLYADAGVAISWRFELDPPHIVVTRTDTGETVTATGGQETLLPAPFGVRLDPLTLVVR